MAAWEQVRAFVNDGFEQRENASRATATYTLLSRDITQQYPHIVLAQDTFKERVALIEDELKIREKIID
jgi:hypothetical protein